MNEKFKAILINVLKLSIAGGLVYWMVSSDKLDFRQLGILVQNWWTLVVIVIGWLVVVLLISSLRWWVLLKGIGLDVAFSRALVLTHIGLFFNSTMPGALGGDLVKAVYVLRDSHKDDKTSAMLTILLDRVVGLMALFVLGGIAVSLSFDQMWQIKLLQPIILIIYGLCVFTSVFFIMVFIPTQEHNDPIKRIFSLRIPGFPLLAKIYDALRAYRQRPWSLFVAMAISVLLQGLLMIYFIYITNLINGESTDFTKFVSIYPVGVLITALPLAPGGFGVGHVAFEELFKVVGLKNGGNAFNIYTLTQLFCSLSGVVAYFLVKKSQGAEARAQLKKVMG